nr:MAG TPA_asm: Protein of unknown function (DUF2746) [Caudoviricetes sp.]
MPPYLDTPEELGTLILAVVTALGALTVGTLGVIATVLVAWRTKVRPLLIESRDEAATAAQQLRNNSGSSTRDAIDRTETLATEIRDGINGVRTETLGEVRALRGEVGQLRDTSERTHAEVFKRLGALETPYRERD